MTSSLPLSSRNRLYAGVAALGAAGGAWLVCASAAGSGSTICPFKLATGFACPACGSTRAVLALFEGRNPLQYNPIGLVTFAVGALALGAATGLRHAQRDRCQPATGLGWTWHIAALAVRHDEDLLQQVVEITGRHTQSLQEAPHKGCMLPEQRAGADRLWLVRRRFSHIRSDMSARGEILHHRLTTS